MCRSRTCELAVGPQQRERTTEGDYAPRDRSRRDSCGTPTSGTRRSRICTGISLGNRTWAARFESSAQAHDFRGYTAYRPVARSQSQRAISSRATLSAQESHRIDNRQASRTTDSIRSNCGVDPTRTAPNNAGPSACYAPCPATHLQSGGGWDYGRISSLNSACISDKRPRPWNGCVRPQELANQMVTNQHAAAGSPWKQGFRGANCMQASTTPIRRRRHAWRPNVLPKARGHRRLRTEQAICNRLVQPQPDTQRIDEPRRRTPVPVR